MKAQVQPQPSELSWITTDHLPTQTCPFCCHQRQKGRIVTGAQNTGICKRFPYVRDGNIFHGPTHTKAVCALAPCAAYKWLFANPPCQWPSEESSQTLYSQTPLYSQRTEHLSSDSYDFQLNFLFCWNMDHLLHHTYFCIINLLACWNHSWKPFSLGLQQ